MNFTILGAILNHVRPMPTRTFANLSTELRAGRAAILCGAGISAASPSGLSLANALVSSARTAFLGRLNARIGSLNVRPETFFKYVYDLDRFELVRFLKNELVSDRLNANHLVLAAALANGNNVITTNFDRLIEHACTRSRLPLNLYVLNYRKTNSGAGTLFKIHGSIDSPRSLATTIDQIGLGLSGHRVRTLKRLTSRRTIVVLGYSGYDQLDIMPTLAQCGYKNIVWISHDGKVARPKRTKPPNQFIATLPRTDHFSCDTSTFLQTLGLASRLPTWPTQPCHPYRTRLAFRQRAQLCIELLMHKSDFRRVLAVIRKERLLRWREFEEPHLRASSTLSNRSFYNSNRSRVVRQLLSRPKRSQVKSAAVIAKYADDIGQILRVKSLVTDALRRKMSLTEQLFEAGVEAVFQLTEHGAYRDATTLLRDLKAANKVLGSVRAEARILLVESNLYGTIGYYSKRRRRSSARHAQLTAARAVELFGRDVFSDEYFQWQAKFNLAIALQLMGKLKAAEKIYAGARNYFSSVSRVYPMQVDYQLALLRYSSGQYFECERLLNAIVRGNRRLGRKFMLGQVFRMKAIVKFKTHPASRNAIARWLVKSAKLFDDQGFGLDAAISARLSSEFKRLGRLTAPIAL